MRTLSLNKIKCRLRKDDWIDDNVVCDIVIEMDNEREASGFIKTSKPLPVKDEFSNFVSGETFEMWFEKPIIETLGIEIRLSNIDQETRKSALLKSCGVLYNKNKK